MTAEKKRQPRRQSKPLWARVLAVIVGALIVVWAVQLRGTLGALEVTFGVVLGGGLIIVALLPSRR